ncbi:hypothetical protein JCM8547_005708 [Rhodosporidiobolus lusitaniae]
MAGGGTSSRTTAPSPPILKPSVESGNDASPFTGGHGHERLGALLDPRDVPTHTLSEIVTKAGGGVGDEVRVFYDPYVRDEEKAKRLEAERADSLEELARRSDCVSVSVPYADSTHHLISSSFFSHLRPGSRLVDIACGPVVSLVVALKSGKLLSAGIDVHEFEPKVSGELREMKTVTSL